MPKMLQTTIQCIQCRQPIRASFQNVVNAADDPQGKIRLLSGRLNAQQCPNCGALNTMLTPLLYHDGGKELLIAFVPMELGLSKDAQEKAIGDLMRELTAQLPQGQFKAYMLQPRHALTMQGLIDQVLQADGVTPEIMEAQRERVRLIETFLEAHPDRLPELVAEHDSRIDAQFFQTLTLLAQRMLQEGRQTMAERAVQVQGIIAELSSYGQQLIERSRVQEEIVRQVADDINTLGANAQRADLLNLALHYAGDEERLQALVGLVRPAMDYQFFQELTLRIGQAPADERDALEGLRESLLELTAMVDQQTQMLLQEAAELLREILQSPNPDEVILENLPMIDSTFMQVLAANVQEAERRGDLAASGRLKDLYGRVVAALQANLPPELQFINELLGAPTDADAGSLVAQRADEFGASLIEAMDAVGQQLAAQGDPALVRRLALVRNAAMRALS